MTGRAWERRDRWRWRDYRPRALAAALAVLLFAAACDTQDAPLPVIRVGHAPHDHHSPLYIAASNPDYFREHGGVWLKELAFRKEYELITADGPVAHLRIDSSTGGKELIRKLSEDQFDISFGGVPAMLMFIDQGSAIKILSPANFEGAGLILRQDLPIEDWAGFQTYLHEHQETLRIGYKIAVSVQNLIFEQALKEAGISFGRELGDETVDINLVNLHGPKNLIPALQQGLIDGFVINQPFLYLARHQGVGKLVAELSELPPEGRWRGYPCCAVAAQEAFVTTRPEIAEALLGLLRRANRFIGEHPGQSAAQIARWLDMPVAVEADSLSSMEFRSRMDADWERGLGVWIETMIERGDLKGRVRHAHKHGGLEVLLYPSGFEEASD